MNLKLENPLKVYVGNFQSTGRLEADVKELLFQHNHEHTYHHVASVAAKAVELAERCGGNLEKAKTAAWLHDISAIVPNDDRIEVSKTLGVDVLPAEETFPMLVHQKLSVPIAQQVFLVEDAEVLSAIECHTTLRANASLTDKIVFVADKIAWDQAGEPPYLERLLNGLESSIDAAALVYLEHLWNLREKLRVLHPWVVEARNDLLKAVK